MPGDDSDVKINRVHYSWITYVQKQIHVHGNTVESHVKKGMLLTWRNGPYHPDRIMCGSQVPRRALATGSGLKENSE